jgi:hypothetical protein
LIVADRFDLPRDLRLQVEGPYYRRAHTFESGKLRMRRV